MINPRENDDNLPELEIIPAKDTVRCGYDRCAKELDEGPHSFDMKTARIYCDDPCVAKDDEEKRQDRRLLSYIELKYSKPAN